MHKDFGKWHRQKEVLHGRTDMEQIFFREREVWWCALGVNIGFEQDGKGEEFRRPILILKKFNQFVILAIPLTTKIKNDNKYYVACDLGDNIPRMAIISQLRLVDTRRLIGKLGVVNEDSFRIIRKSVKAMI